MQKEDQEKFRPLIETRTRELTQQMEEGKEDARPIEPDRAIGRLSRLDSMQMQQMALGARQRQQQELDRLRDALRRIDEGNYGQCLKCGEDIARDRLEYQPDAVVCVRCAQR